MIVSFYKIASNNFTKLLNGLDKQKKLIMKEVKKLMKETKTKQRIKKEISWHWRRCLHMENSKLS